MGIYYFMDTMFIFVRMKVFWRWMVVTTAHGVNVINAIKLYTYKWLKWWFSMLYVLPPFKKINNIIYPKPLTYIV